MFANDISLALICIKSLCFTITLLVMPEILALVVCLALLHTAVPVFQILPPANVGVVCRFQAARAHTHTHTHSSLQRGVSVGRCEAASLFPDVS